jgi:hypothetical protein
MVTPGTTVTAAPSHTWRPITVGAGTMSARRSGAGVLEAAAEVDEDVRARGSGSCRTRCNRGRVGHGLPAVLDATDKDVEIGGAKLAAAAIGLGLIDELRIFRYPVVVGGGTPLLPPVTEHVRLDLVETRTFGSRVVYERYRRGPRRVALTPLSGSVSTG